MNTNDTTRANTSAAPATPSLNPISNAARAEALIQSVEADLDFIIYKSTDPRAHEIACTAKRKIVAHRAANA